jgi:hypothetical protein
MSSLPDITVDWLMARVVQRDECLIWKGEAANAGRDPRGVIDNQRFYVRRAVWKAMSDGREPPKQLRIGVSCDQACCVEPSHLIGRSQSVAASVGPMPLAQRAKIAAGKRAKSKLGQEQVQEILASELPGRAEAKRHGISKDMVNLIRAGKLRRDYTNPFLQLGAR